MKLTTLHNIFTGEVHAIIISETTTGEMIHNIVEDVKRTILCYDLDDIKEALPDDCKVYMEFDSYWY